MVRGPSPSRHNDRQSLRDPLSARVGPAVGGPLGGIPVALNHAHGALTIEADEIVNREHGKNPLTRKEWDKDVRVGVGTIAWILVQSRDRLSFDFDLIDGTRTSMLHVAGCAPKVDLDAFLRDFAAANPSALIQLAHPSYGLPDPVHEQAK